MTARAVWVHSAECKKQHYFETCEDANRKSISGESLARLITLTGCRSERISEKYEQLSDAAKGAADGIAKGAADGIEKVTRRLKKEVRKGLGKARDACESGSDNEA